MIRFMAFAACLASISACASLPREQSPLPAAPSSSSEPQGALAFYLGTWTALNNKEHEGVQETCSWLETIKPRQHIVCRSRKETDEGPRESLGIYSYDQTSGEYLYHSFGSSGVYTERGQRIANGFRFNSVRGTGADQVQARFTIVEGAEGHVKTVTETSKAGGPWVVEERVEYLHTRP